MARIPKSDAHPKVRVLIADDHPMVRERLAEVIRQQRDMEVCGEAGEAGRVIHAVAELRPDIVLLDLNFKGVLALDLIKDIKASNASLPILVISMYDESVFAERALRAGARGFVSKEEPTKVVVDAIRLVLGGGRYLSEHLASRLAQAYISGRDKLRGDSLEKLTDRELEVLEMIGHGQSTRRVAETLHIDMRTVETYRARIKEKLGLETSGELLMRAIEWVQSGGPH